MVLQNKNAIIYGAAGSLGSEIAKAFAAAGARVFLTGRHIEVLNQVADQIKASGGMAESDEVDASDEAAIVKHINKVIQQSGAVDISFNLTGTEVVQDIPLVDMSVKDFIQPITISMQTRFLTAVAAAKVMMNQRSGVILSLTATPGGIGYPYTGGFAPTCSAIESLSRNLAAELGVYGVRVINIRSAGSPDSRMFKEAIDNHPDIMAPVLHKMKADTMLKELPPMADIANVAIFLASELAKSITGVTVDVTAGTTASLNYHVRNP
ncbi:MAG: SDR family oxidoreductase [Chitinophagaceae bacterium]|nr:MAG: SDR family oxidoreductase [Chitinophagaceae bacterium]